MLSAWKGEVSWVCRLGFILDVSIGYRVFRTCEHFMGLRSWEVPQLLASEDCGLLDIGLMHWITLLC